MRTAAVIVLTWWFCFHHDGQAWQLFSVHGSYADCAAQVGHFQAAGFAARCVEFKPW
jgi:hypothetical protein